MRWLPRLIIYNLWSTKLINLLWKMDGLSSAIRKHLSRQWRAWLMRNVSHSIRWVLWNWPVSIQVKIQSKITTQIPISYLSWTFWNFPTSTLNSTTCLVFTLVKQSTWPLRRREMCSRQKFSSTCKTYFSISCAPRTRLATAAAATRDACATVSHTRACLFWVTQFYRMATILLTISSLNLLTTCNIPKWILNSQLPSVNFLCRVCGSTVPRRPSCHKRRCSL